MSADRRQDGLPIGERVAVLEDWRRETMDPWRTDTDARLHDGDNEFEDHRAHIDKLYDSMTDHLCIEHGLQDVNLRKPLFRPRAPVPQVSVQRSPEEAVREAAKENRERLVLWLKVIGFILFVAGQLVTATLYVARLGG